MADFPDLATHKILRSFAGSSVFQLVTLASVSSGWRGIVRQLHLPELRFESAQELQHRAGSQRDAFAAKFQRGALVTKTAFFLAAARLLRRHTAVFCSGPAITDAVLTEVAKGSAERVTIQGCCHVTDSSLTALLLLCPDLQHLHLVDLPAVRGGFLLTLFRKARKLKSLTLTNLPALKWEFLLLCSPPTASLPSVQSLTVEDARLEESQHALLTRFPRLKSLSLGCHPSAVWAATQCCPELEEVTLTNGSPACLDDCLAALLSAPALRALELCPRGFTLTCSQLRLVGMLPLRELRLHSHAFKQQPLNRVSHSHLDNEGVKALVDSICTRCLFQRGKQPFQLSLCGATGITHNAVSALLRLPLLSGLLITGCCRISSIDKMRLVAKVKAGRELLEGGAKRRPPQEPHNVLIPCIA